MSFFESLIALLLIAILLLQVARRIAVPYPAMLAAAGVVLALVPGVPSIGLDPETALALFIAPALVDAAFDFPAGAVWRLWRPLFALAVVAVLLTAGAVAWLGVAMAGLPLFAALGLGAIVAPPDAAAATATLSSVTMPRRTVALLKGESLLNDALALLLFGAVLQIQRHGHLDMGIGLRLAVAAPAGVVFGIVLALLYRRVARFVGGTLGGHLLEFVFAFALWIVAERLRLSAVLCVVAFAMTIARSAGLSQPARSRVHSFAVWDTVVFLLNVLAFLLMGMQTRAIVGAMPVDRLREALWFSGAVVICVILVRIGWVLVYNRLAHRFAALRGDYEPAGLRQGFLVGWCGMRGLVTMATAFALPGNFPQRDLIVLCAFSVVLATLVVQGLTLAPLVRRLRLDRVDDLPDELSRARTELADAALAKLAGDRSAEGDKLRRAYADLRHAETTGDAAAIDNKRRLGIGAIRAQRRRLETLRANHSVGADAFLILQEELDFKELAIASEDERHIEEG